ncbi:helix-turn-helix domain-containing protein [uncultured Maritimibacter sp.]|uniref:helix-turn-helix domain-containing protein n=1 Tax=uncultured Maritimibacter sp. TaxID=991866 RepID=UPI002638B2D8|nr:helix-turn-helix domain-containing protein [uncultured Maritimibacter sp.]
MSHKATTWLAGMSGAELSNSEFRVLFHLCDCHNPSAGCFPTQAYLRDATGVSNGTLNNALNALEERGLLRREKCWDEGSKKQLPTRYILGFELESAQVPSPKSGDGYRGEPSPKTGDGAVSKKRGEPSPKNRGSRLQPTGEGTCKEPVRNPGGPVLQAPKRSENSAVIADAERAVRTFREGRRDALADVAVWVRSHILAAGLLTEGELHDIGWTG